MSYPQDVGIKAMEIYFPNQYVEQAELEKFDGVSEGKYTVGLGQTKMSFCDDREDIYSISLTAVSSLISKYGIDVTKIGRLEVGTETILDKSKSVKTVLMQLFAESGNTDIEGVDTVNACYSGTNALLNAVNWVKGTHDTDGRDAIVVAGDIALYSKGNARPTGGAGCVAMLVGPNAPLVLEPVRGTHMAHVYDFYKPDLASEYPVVQGQYSLKCYTEAVDKCYEAYAKKKQMLQKTEQEQLANGMNGHADSQAQAEDRNGYTNGVDTSTTTLDGEQSDKATIMNDFDYMCFHAPTCKLVSKAYARFFYNDFCTDPSNETFKSVSVDSIPIDKQASLEDRDVEKTFLQLTKKDFEARVRPSLLSATMCGNMYSGSLYGGLGALLCSLPAEMLAGKRIGMFSYGSGLASTLFSLRVAGDVSAIQQNFDLHNKVESRTEVAPTDYEKLCGLREKAFLQKDYVPEGSVASIPQGAFYLERVDDMFKRYYSVKA